MIPIGTAGWQSSLSLSASCSSPAAGCLDSRYTAPGLTAASHAGYGHYRAAFGCAHSADRTLGWRGYLKNLKRFKRTDFHIRVGESFILDTGGTEVTGEMRQQIVDEMMFQLAALLPEVYRGEYFDLGNSTKNICKSLITLHI
jgi:hypothetical protein